MMGRMPGRRQQPDMVADHRVIRYQIGPSCFEHRHDRFRENRHTPAAKTSGLVMIRTQKRQTGNGVWRRVLALLRMPPSDEILEPVDGIITSLERGIVDDTLVQRQRGLDAQDSEFVQGAA